MVATAPAPCVGISLALAPCVGIIHTRALGGTCDLRPRRCVRIVERRVSSRDSRAAVPDNGGYYHDELRCAERAPRADVGRDHQRSCWVPVCSRAPARGLAASWRAVAARPSGFVRRAAENKDGVSPVESGRTSRCEGARLRCVLAGSAGAAVWAVQEPFDQWVFRSHYSDVAVLGKVAIGGRAWWPAGLALHLVNGAVFGLVYCEARRRWPQRPRRLAMSMALGEHVALYPLSYFVDRFHPRRGTRGIPPLLENPRAFAQATWRHTIFGLVLGRLA